MRPGEGKWDGERNQEHEATTSSQEMPVENVHACDVHLSVCVCVREREKEKEGENLKVAITQTSTQTLPCHLQDSMSS